MGYETEGMTDYEETLNWDDVGSVVAVGDYDAEIVKVEHTFNKNKKHMLKVQLKVEAAYDEENEKSVGRTLFDNWNFTQEGGFRPKQFSVATGEELPTMVSKDLLEQWAEKITGTHVGLSVTHREYNGQTQPSISKFFAYQNGDNAASDEAVETPAPAAQRAPAAQTQSIRQGVPNGKATNGTNGAAKAAKPAGKSAPQMRR